MSTVLFGMSKIAHKGVTLPPTHLDWLPTSTHQIYGHISQICLFVIYGILRIYVIWSKHHGYGHYGCLSKAQVFGVNLAVFNASLECFGKLIFDVNSYHKDAE